MTSPAPTVSIHTLALNPGTTPRTPSSLLASLQWQLHLLAACERGALAEVRTLLEGSDIPNRSVNVADNQGVTPLINAVASGNLDLVKLLVEGYNADINYVDKEDFGAVTVAAYLGHVEIVAFLMSRPEFKLPPTKHHPLLAACTKHLPLVQYLVETAGCDVNERGPRGYTPLMMAAEAGQLHIVRYLIRHGADPDLTNDDRLTVMDIIPTASAGGGPSLSEAAPRAAPAPSPSTDSLLSDTKSAPGPAESGVDRPALRRVSSNPFETDGVSDDHPYAALIRQGSAPGHRGVVTRRDVVSAIRAEQKKLHQEEVQRAEKRIIPVALPIYKGRACFSIANNPRPMPPAPAYLKDTPGAASTASPDEPLKNEAGPQKALPAPAKRNCNKGCW